MRISDWSSDVCSSDLSCNSASAFSAFSAAAKFISSCVTGRSPCSNLSQYWSTASTNWQVADTKSAIDRKSAVSGKSVSVRVDLGGRRIIQKKKQQTLYTPPIHDEDSKNRQKKP